MVVGRRFTTARKAVHPKDDLPAVAPSHPTVGMAGAVARCTLLGVHGREGR